MRTISEKQLTAEFVGALRELDNKGKELIRINLSGQKFVVLKEEDYRGWLETAYLLSSSTNAKVLQEAMEAPLEQCKDLRDVLKELDS